MSEQEQDMIIAATVRDHRTKKERLVILEEKAKRMARDCEIVADLLASERRPEYHTGYQEREHRKTVWAGKIEGQADTNDVAWPSWEEVSGVFRELRELRESVAELRNTLKDFGVD